MGIFTDKLEMSKRIEEQKKTIALLNSEIAARKKEIVNLNSKLRDTERQNADIAINNMRAFPKHAK